LASNALKSGIPQVATVFGRRSLERYSALSPAPRQSPVCAGVMAFSAESFPRVSMSCRLRSRFSPVKRGRCARKSRCPVGREPLSKPREGTPYAVTPIPTLRARARCVAPAHGWGLPVQPGGPVDINVIDTQPVQAICQEILYGATGLASKPSHCPSGPLSAPNLTESSALSRRPFSARPMSSSL
jgi:hypothetical protein